MVGWTKRLGNRIVRVDGAQFKNAATSFHRNGCLPGQAQIGSQVGRQMNDPNGVTSASPYTTTAPKPLP